MSKKEKKFKKVFVVSSCYRASLKGIEEENLCPFAHYDGSGETCIAGGPQNLQEYRFSPPSNCPLKNPILVKQEK